MKIEEDEMSDDLKTKINGEVTQTEPYKDGYVVDTIIAAQDITKDLGESNKKLDMIKRPINKGITTKLVGNTKLKKPVGKLTSSLPIMGEKEEAVESMGASSAGGFEAPLFSTTKQEMQEKCWVGYQQKGVKTKGGRMVPNCIKEDEDVDVKKVEATEATGSGSSGSYETTAVWAKSTSKKDWGGKRKTQIPGGKFVQVKKKCKKFPYCNQGDIKSLNLYENDMVKQAIQNVSKKHNISENVIKTIISYEYEKMLLNKK